MKKKKKCLPCLIGKLDAWCPLCGKGMCLKCYTLFLREGHNIGASREDVRDFFRLVGCKCKHFE